MLDVRGSLALLKKKKGFEFFIFSLLTNQNENSNDSNPSSESEESNDNTRIVAGSQNAVKKGYCVKQGGVVSIYQSLLRFICTLPISLRLKYFDKN